ncbi:MAG TPA: hypothetical protein VGZ73_24215 [Bryobacteraceae bacterium]|jgi:hypothetical protein|nr:hypothetical protein [Bryobacteraceae bacterium]
MLKKIGLSAIALAAMMILVAPPQANAAVRFGVSIGAPVYTYPVNPYSYAYPNDPYAYPNYAYPAAPYAYGGYAAPYYSYRWGGHERDERHEWREHEHRDYRAPAFRGHEDFRGRRR